MPKKMRVPRTMTPRRTNMTAMNQITKRMEITLGLKMTTAKMKMKMMTMRAPDLKMMIVTTVMGMEAIVAR
jgi:hypothetical protein